MHSVSGAYHCPSNACWVPIACLWLLGSVYHTDRGSQLTPRAEATLTSLYTQSSLTAPHRTPCNSAASLFQFAVGSQKTTHFLCKLSSPCQWIPRKDLHWTVNFVGLSDPPNNKEAAFQGRKLTHRGNRASAQIHHFQKQDSVQRY